MVMSFLQREGTDVGMKEKGSVAPATVPVKIKEGVGRPFRIFYLIQTTAA